jgi:hypothetical protein
MILRIFYINLPRSHLINILINLTCIFKCSLKRSFEIVAIHVHDEFIDSFFCIKSHIVLSSTSFYISIKLERKCDESIEEVSEIIREFRIVDEDGLFLIEVSIFSDRKSSEEIEEERITRIRLTILNRINHISDCFGHLLSFNCKVSGSKELLRCLISSTPEHSWPIYPMEFYDIFSDNMEVGWPPLPHFVATHSEIVKESVIPNIRHLLTIKRKWNAELIRLSRDGKILQSTFYKFYNLIVSSPWLYKIRMSLIKFEDFILILWKSKKIIFFLQLFERFIGMISTDKFTIFFN